MNVDFTSFLHPIIIILVYVQSEASGSMVVISAGNLTFYLIINLYSYYWYPDAQVGTIIANPSAKASLTCIMVFLGLDFVFLGVFIKFITIRYLQFFSRNSGP